MFPCICQSVKTCQDMSVKMASKTVIRPITQDEKNEGKTLIITLFLFSLAGRSYEESEITDAIFLA